MSAQKNTLNSIGMALGLSVGLVVFIAVMGSHYPVGEWLFWRYAGYWLATSFWVIGCFSTGHVIVTKILGRPLRALEQIPVSFCAGFFAFEVLMSVAGVFKLFGSTLFFVMPLTCIAIGARPGWHYVKRLARHVNRQRQQRAPAKAWELITVGFGVLMFIAIYLSIMTPENAQFDSRWKHMGLAEEWVARGGIERFPEGLTFATRPHFTSFLFAWGFMAPGTLLFDQVLLCAHIEFWVFLITTVFGIPALVRRLVPGASPRLLWVSRFLFPGTLLYDSSLAIGADHIGAAFCVPVFLMALEVLRRCEPRRAALLGYVMAAAALVKYTIAMFFYPATLTLFFFGAVKGLRHTLTRKDAVLGIVALVIAGLISSSPHWLKNWIWYGNPVYPLLPQLFNNDPWTADATYAFKYAYQEFQFWRPERSVDGVFETLKTLLTFSFIPNNYPNYHGKTPVIGSLFTLALLTLPFLRIHRAGGKRRFPWTLFILFLVTHSAVFIWYWVHHQDRYLQGVMPWMAACTAAVVVLIWRHGGLIARIPLVILLVTQVIWGGDVYFLPAHAHIGKTPLEHVIKLLGAGHKKDYDKRLVMEPHWTKVGSMIPKDGKLLLHDNHISLGLKRAKLSDWQTWQYGLSYGLLESPKGVYEKLKELGVTHLHWVKDKSRAYDSLAGDFLFFDFAHRHTKKRKRVGRAIVASMPDKALQVYREGIPRAVIFGCGRSYRSGVYDLTQLRTSTFGPQNQNLPAPKEKARGKKLARLVKAARFIAVDPGCRKRHPKWDSRAFKRVAKRRRLGKVNNRPYHLYIRRSGRATSIPKALGKNK